MKSKEQVYDEKVAPLMAQLIAICKNRKIAMLCDFSLDEDLHCTSALLDDEYEPSEGQLAAFKALRPTRAPTLTVKRFDAEGNLVGMDAIVG